MLETIAEVRDPSIARVLIAALRAHGFHPPDGGEGLPGMPGVYPPEGIAIAVPESEADDARLLARSLLRDMEN